MLHANRSVSWRIELRFDWLANLEVAKFEDSRESGGVDSKHSDPIGILGLSIDQTRLADRKTNRFKGNRRNTLAEIRKV